MFRIKSCFTKFVRYVATSRPTKSPIRSGVTLAFGKYLLLTNTVSSGVLMIIGDVCQQEIEYRQNKLRQRYDLGRLSMLLGVFPLVDS